MLGRSFSTVNTTQVLQNEKIRGGAVRSAPLATFNMGARVRVMITTELAEPIRARARRSSWVAAGAMLGLVVLLVIALLPDRVTPRPVPASAHAAEFSSERALRDVRRIAARPHPVGTREHLQVAAYIAARLSAIGMHVDEQRATHVESSDDGEVVAVAVRNLLARKPGFDNTKAVLLTAHYDAAVTSPGAGDAATGVAALLETARALHAGPPLRNDVVFLFTDAEEPGLFGAKAFRDQHPAFGSIGAVLNFEARGVRGPSIMFEVGRRSGWLVRHLLDAAPHPYVSSLASTIYELMPNATDFTVFKDAGLSGLNFAFVEGWPKYHTALDSPSNLDEGSLQHHGSYATALARRLGQTDLTQGPEDGLIYFNVIGALVVSYAARWAFPLAVTVAIVYMVALIDARRRSRVSTGRLGLAIVLLPASVALAGTACYAYQTWIVGGVYEGFLLYRAAYHQAACVLVAALAIVLVFIGSFRWLGMYASCMGVLFWWTLAALAAAWYVPGASYAFAWPALVNVAACWLLMRKPEGPSHLRRAALLTAAAACSAVILVPPGKLLALGLALSGASVLGGYAAFCFLLLGPQVAVMLRPNRWALPALLACALVAVSLVMRAGPVYDAMHPKHNRIAYVLDHDRGAAAWVTSQRGFDTWVGAVLATGPANAAQPLPAWYSAGFPRSVRLLSAGAPRADLMPPSAVVVEDVAASRRTIRLKVRSDRAAPKMAIIFEAAGPLVLLSVNGRAPDAPAHGGSRLVLHLLGSGTDGMEIALQAPSAPVHVQVLDHSYELPSDVTGTLPPRSPAMMPTMSNGDATIVVRSLEL